MTDTIDQAQAFDQMHRDHALNRRVPMPQIGRTHCIDCDYLIPAPRRAAHPTADRCTFCQDQMEKTQ